MNKWMIWGYHYFWKHPYHLKQSSFWSDNVSFFGGCSCLVFLWCFLSFFCANVSLRVGVGGDFSYIAVSIGNVRMKFG